MLARDDQDAIEALAPDAADPALRVRLRAGRRDRRADHPDPLRPEDLVEGSRELAVAVADQEPRPLLLFGPLHHQVARLLRDPSTVRVGGHTSEMDAPTLELNEEEHMQPPQPERLDSKEVTLKDPRGLLAQELAPADARLGAGSTP
jgi:hypothetical protein